MKRILTFLITILTLISINAQENIGHLKFKNIPINGTIVQFQNQLLKRNCTLDRRTSSIIPAGCRAFKGTLAGNKVEIYVFFDKTTKIVYRVKSIVSDVSSDMAIQEYYKIKDLLSKKYTLSDIGERENSEASTFDATNGKIDLFITKDDNEFIRYPLNYNLHIDYQDKINSDKHEKNELNEL